ncbi:Signal transduction histidine kinase [Alkalispirochaeta americana]|uniref:histidine kinase n=2 Tax=Alkalispirochaeta americana TaxID=159291 RepID=A0A1N6NIU4_9SPIO|nr:Signal transduction histidine kinase [Alkalispirochaeta americana]
MVAFQEFPAGFWQDVLLLGVLAGGLLVLLLLGYSPLLLGLAVFVLWLLAVYLSFSLPSPGAAPLLPLLGAATLLSVVRSSTRGVVLTVTMLGCFIFAAYPVVVTYNHSVAGLDLAGRVLLAGPALVLHLVARLSARIEQTLERERQKNLQLEKTVGVLSRANVGFQQYAQNLEVRSRDEERKRITRDLHDTIGYMISAITVMLDAALGFLHSSPERCAEVLQKARNHVDATHQETRTALHALHSLESATAFGVENIHEIAKSFGAATGVKVEVFFSNVAKTYGGVVDATMYRFVQEALVNAFRHGKAKNIQVALWHHPGELQVYVRDDGEGSSDLEEGIGFLGMRERLSQVQGQLAYETLKSGFRVTARIPVEPNPEAGKARKDAPEGTLKEEER